MKGPWLSLGLLASLSVAAQTPTASLSWTAPTANSNGTTISAAITYNVYQGAQGAALVKIQSGVSAAAATVTSGLAAGTTQCFAVTAVVNGQESAQSTSACAAISFPTPNAPSQITVVIH